MTYTSNALEGNTLTRSETAIVLQKGITVSGKPLKDHLEAEGHKDALLFMRELVQNTGPVLEVDIRNLHRLVMRKVSPDKAGAYSRNQRMMAGSDILLPFPAEIAPLMEEFAQWITTVEPIRSRPSMLMSGW